MKQRSKSTAVYDQMCQIIPGGVNSPVRACLNVKQSPLVAASGKGDLITDADGNTYIDYCCSWGALIHGHAHPQIVEAAQKRMLLGSSFGITTEIEGKLARKVVDLIDSIEKIRFVSSGTEATMSAARLARGFTGRSFVVKFAGHYHGHADFFLVQAGSGVAGLTPTSTSAGIPDEVIKHTICAPFNDLEKCRALLRDPSLKNQIAAVILEPVAGNMGVVPATQEFIDMLREETRQIGALLIFDEVMTGFRVGLKGAQELYGITPDLTTFAKIIGGGFPVAAFGGRREIMDRLAPLGPVYQAGTLSGNPVAMEAGLQALTLLEKPGFYEDLERKTRLITDPVQKAFKNSKIPGCVQQVGSMFTLFFGRPSVTHFEETRLLDNELFGKFFRFLFSKGIYIPPLHVEAWFVSSAHTEEHLAYTRDCILEFLETEASSK